MAFESGYTGDGFTCQEEEDFAEQQSCERAVEENDFRGRDRDEWKHEAAAWQKLK